MSPNDIAIHDQQLVRHLLGLLPPDEADRIDELTIVDDEIAARLRGVEDDLVDAYVRGALSGDTLTRFESHYLSSPLRRRRALFAKSLVPAVDRATPTAPVAAPQSQRPRWTPALAVAAAVLLAACVGLVVQTARLGRGLAVARSEQSAGDARTRRLEQQLADLRAAHQNAIEELERARASASPAQAEVPHIALVLLPQTRGLGQVPTLAVPAGIARIGFELRLEASDSSRYQVVLRDPATTAIVWQSGWTAAKSSAGVASLVIALPSALLKPQHYTFDVSGRGADGAPEVIGSYTFEIVPR